MRPNPRWLRADVLAATFTLLITSPALAGDGLPALSQSALRALAALGGVLALILVLSWLLRRFREASAARADGPSLASLGRLDLGSRREIRVVRVLDRLLVVGVTEQRCELLTELPAHADASPVEATPAPECGPPALEVLRRLATSS